MPNNQLVIEYQPGNVECNVWDSQGNKHDIGDIFQQMKDLTSKGRESAEISLQSTQNNLSTNIKFEAIKKELSYRVTAAVIAQILEMKT